VQATIDEDVRRAAYRIIRGKGATWYGIAGGIARIVRAIAGDERAVLTVSALIEGSRGEGPVALSLPQVAGRDGVLHTLNPHLSAEEQGLIERSAAILRETAGGRW
jgi:L-lactate dehydrogenase